MRIVELLISTGRGGAEKSVFDLSKCLINHGCEVKLFLNKEIIKYFQEFNSENVINIGTYKNKRKYKSQALNKIYSLINGFRLRFLGHLNEKIISKNIKKSLNRYNPDILHIHLHPALILFTRLNLKYDYPVIFTMRGDIINYHKVFKNKQVDLEKAYIKLGLKKVNYITSECNFFLEILKNSGFNRKKETMEILPKILNLDLIKSIDVQKKHKTFDILFVGGARYLKGGDILINSLPKIIKEIPNLKLYILREVSKNNVIRKLVEKYDLTNNVEFVGFIDIPDYYKYMKSVDLGVLPSRTEGIAPSIIEFMTCGIPIVASKVGGTPEIICDGENGILVDLNPISLAQGIIYLYKNPNLMKKISENGINSSKKYTCAYNYEKYIHFFNNIIGTK